jgi:HlyD family secretion protein
MNRKLLIGAVVLTVVALAAIYYWVSRAGEKSVNLRVSGNVEVTSVALSFKLPGRIRERLVDEGEPVKVGQIIARLDNEDLVHEAGGRLAEVQLARAALAELENGYRKEDVAQAKAALDRVTSEAVRLKVDFARQQELYKREVISRREFDSSRAAYESSQASVREAVQKLALLQRGPRPETIDQSRARLHDAEAMLALAKVRLGYTTLISSVNGQVLSKNIEPGEQVAAGTPVVTVGILDNVWVRAYIGETDLGRVKTGQQADVTTDTWPGRKYKGVISFISPEAEFTPKNVQTEKERVKLVYRIKVVIPNPNLELKPGMPADVEIQTGKSKT